MFKKKAEVPDFIYIFQGVKKYIMTASILTFQLDHIDDDSSTAVFHPNPPLVFC